MSTAETAPSAPSPPTAASPAMTVIGLHRAIEHAVISAGSTMARYWALWLIRRGYASTGEISRAMGVAPSSTTVVVDGLEREGLVERRRATEDRRRVVVRITAPGRQVLADVDAEANALLRELAEELDPGDRDAALEGLGTWWRALDRARDKRGEGPG